MVHRVESCQGPADRFSELFGNYRKQLEQFPDAKTSLPDACALSPARVSPFCMLARPCEALAHVVNVYRHLRKSADLAAGFSVPLF